MPKKYSVSQARTHLSVLITEAAFGSDIEILVFEQPYVVLTRTKPTEIGPDSLIVTMTEARNKWSQLLSAVANDDARFSFIRPGSNTEVYLRRADGYSNPFIEKWTKHIALENNEPLADATLVRAIDGLSQIDNDLAHLQRRVRTILKSAKHKAALNRENNDD